MIVDIHSSAGNHWHIEFDSVHPLRSLKRNARVLKKLAAIRHDRPAKKLDHAQQQYSARHARTHIGPMI